MDEILNYSGPAKELELFEKIFFKELNNEGWTSVETKVNYATSLVHSQYPPDNARGILIFENLLAENPERRREHLYFLCLACARTKKYSRGIEYCQMFLRVEENLIVRALYEHMQHELDKSNMLKVAVAGGAALVFGGLIGSVIKMAFR